MVFVLSIALITILVKSINFEDCCRDKNDQNALEDLWRGYFFRTPWLHCFVSFKIARDDALTFWNFVSREMQWWMEIELTCIQCLTVVPFNSGDRSHSTRRRGSYRVLSLWGRCAAATSKEVTIANNNDQSMILGWKKAVDNLGSISDCALDEAWWKRRADYSSHGCYEDACSLSDLATRWVCVQDAWNDNLTRCGERNVEQPWLCHWLNRRSARHCY